jgi:hypothetical protein
MCHIGKCLKVPRGTTPTPAGQRGSIRGRGRSQALAPDTSNDCVQELGGEHARGSAKHQPPASGEDPQPSTEDSEDGATRPQKRAALGARKRLKRHPPAGAIGHRHHKRHREEVYSSSDGGLTSSERDTDPSDSDQAGHDDRQPKCRMTSAPPNGPRKSGDFF